MSISQRVKYKMFNSGIPFVTVAPNHNVMEGFDFGDSPHPILRGLFCRGKVTSIWFLLFFWGDKQIKGLILNRLIF